MPSKPSHVLRTDAAQVVRRYYELVDGNDLAGLAGVFSRDIVYLRPGYEPIVGLDQLLEFYKNIRVIEFGRHQLDKVIGDETTVAVAGRFTGTTRAHLVVRQRFADFFTIHSGWIVARSTYFDSPAV